MHVRSCKEFYCARKNVCSYVSECNCNGTPRNCLKPELLDCHYCVNKDDCRPKFKMQYANRK